jgi:hypothetical protein
VMKPFLKVNKCSAYIALIFPCIDSYKEKVIITFIAIFVALCDENVLKSGQKFGLTLILSYIDSFNCNFCVVI